MKRRTLLRIETMEDLAYEKYLLQKKINKKELNIKNKAIEIKNNLSVSSVLDSMGLNGDLLTALIPLFFKYKGTITQSDFYQNLTNTPQKKKITQVILGIGASLLVYFLYRKFKSRK